MDNIIELNELNYVGAKLVSDNFGISQKNPNRNTKAEWKMRLEGQRKRLRLEAKMLTTEKCRGIYFEEKKRKQTSRKV